MRIGMVLNSSFPPDFRIEKEVETLLAEHDVFLLCTKDGNAPAKEEWRGMQITRALAGFERRRATLQLMRSCDSPLWKREIDRFVRDNRLDVLHAHDLPIAGPALLSARSHRIPIVVDLHEDYPALLADIRQIPWRQIASTGVLGLKVTPSIERWRQYERNVVLRADAVICVIEESADRIVDLGASPSNVHLVANYAAVSEADLSAEPRHSDTVMAVYFGNFDQERDLKTVLEAADVLAKRGTNKLEIILIGGSAREISLLKKYASTRQLDVGNVKFHEWMDRERAEEMMAGAHVGLVTHVKSAHTDTTIPHKLFQYMGRQLPVIVSNCAPLERIVNDVGCGLVYEAGNASSLAACFDDLYRSPGKRIAMGNAGYLAARTRYNWSVAAENLLDLYGGLASQNQRTKRLNDNHGR